MKNNFELNIGLEIHVVIDTRSKMFSGSRNRHSDRKNKNINEVDLGIIGTLPSVNKKAVEKAIVFAHCLNTQIDHQLIFDRKNYFYQDLPRGYQITQFFRPIGVNGSLEINVEDYKKTILIQDIHLEEDTAKQIKDQNQIFLDYNRSGLPLIEIVTKPCFSSAIEVKEFIKKLRRILQFNNISDVKMENGSLRIDLNISVRPIGYQDYNTRSEIKNINTISEIDKIIEFEYDRKVSNILMNIQEEPDTRMYDQDLNQTVFMRKKDNEYDYRYQVETNIFPINIDQKFINRAIKKFYFDIDELNRNLLENGLDQKMINFLLDNKKVYKKFIVIASITNDYKEAYKWFCVELNGIVTKNNKSLSDVSNFIIKQIANLINLIKQKRINTKQAKELIRYLYDEKLTVDKLITKYGLEQISDENQIKEMMLKYFKQNENMLNQYSSRAERVQKFFIGMVMKDTNGQANPNVCQKVFLNLINDYLNEK